MCVQVAHCTRALVRGGILGAGIQHLIEHKAMQPHRGCVCQEEGKQSSNLPALRGPAHRGPLFLLRHRYEQPEVLRDLTLGKRLLHGAPDQDSLLGVGHNSTVFSHKWKLRWRHTVD